MKESPFPASESVDVRYDSYKKGEKQPIHQDETSIINEPPPYSTEQKKPLPVSDSISQSQSQDTSIVKPQPDEDFARHPKKTRSKYIIIGLVAVFLFFLVLYTVRSIWIEKNIEEVQQNPLIAAVVTENIDEINRLLSEGANPNQKVPDTSGWTLLIVAARMNNPRAAQKLLGAGADPNQKDSIGWAPFHHTITAKTAPLEIIKMLAEGGADVNVMDNHGRTPLHRAAMFGHVDAVELLLNLGANSAIKDKQGLTPLDRGRAYPAVFNILKSRK